MTTSSTSRRSSARGAAGAALYGRTDVLPGVAVCWTGRPDGDLSHRAGRAATRAMWRRRAGRPVAWLHQVHGAGVVVADAEDVAGRDGDALVTASSDLALAVTTADCAPLALADETGSVAAAVHAGWRGIAAGVIEATVEAMRSAGATRVVGALGPCIRAECYAFGEPDLARLVSRLGPRVAARHAGGGPSLDLAAAVGAALAGVGARLVHDEEACTACEPDRWFSFRARAEHERQAMVVWRT